MRKQDATQAEQQSDCAKVLSNGVAIPVLELQQDLQDLKDLGRDSALGPSTEAIVQEAEKKGIPWMQLGARFLIQLGYGANQKADAGNDDGQHQHLGSRTRLR